MRPITGHPETVTGPGALRVAAGAARILGVMAGLTILAASAQAEPPRTRPEVMAAHRFLKEYNETLVTLPIEVTTADGRSHKVEFQLTHYRPDGSGPFPVLIIHHGRSEDRTYPSRIRGGRSIEYYLARGFTVMVPTRVGFGGLGTKIDPETGLGVGCAANVTEQQTQSVLAHTRAVLKYAARLPFADVSRVVLTGQSVGGYTSIGAAALGVPGVVGVINLAGGVGARMKRSPSAPHCPDNVEKAFVAAGTTLRVPTLWLYASNDRAWGAYHPKNWHQAFVAAGGIAEYVMLPAVEGDGHSEVSNSVSLWRRYADAYFAKLGFKVPAIANPPRATTFAALDDVTRLPSKETGAAEAYRAFLRLQTPRAFVIAPNGVWSSDSGSAQSLATALSKCAARSNQTCKPYAVDDAIVWTP